MKLNKIFGNKMKKLNIATAIFLSFFSHTIMAVEETAEPSGYVEVFRFSESEPENQTYVSKEESKQLNPKKMSDAEKLAKSIEFEVYEVGENRVAHTVFKSGAGICRGFKSHYGVDLTDSRTYYVDQANNEYYASIAGATIYSKNAPENVQYVPVFNIQDEKLAQQVQDEENKYGKQVATQNIAKNSEMLKKTICR
ncbi:hypothetical protein C3007_09440 [Avibacterium gallinarum]|uniref:Lipoprotein-2 n=3 Tax=Avibacterium gallinarum TaxID=755 RepID=A0A379AY42_AVIGA|nr:hypothetical protein C3007_09440 [Avibacterium gallinarum]TDP28311.1 hypothetical protein EV689_10681 [Avibacterium gallinarum]SUB27179.1 lipoprotein-2 [Avibacterium gallinarum]